jgi:hypothetical protein
LQNYPLKTRFNAILRDPLPAQAEIKRETVLYSAEKRPKNEWSEGKIR